MAYAQRQAQARAAAEAAASAAREEDALSAALRDKARL